MKHVKAQIILHDHTVNVTLNKPVIEVSAHPDGKLVKVTGGVGPQGPRGYSPQRGIDFWTNADKEAIMSEAVETILAVYPAAEEAAW